MGDNDAGESGGEIGGGGDAGEIGVAAVVQVAHVHAAVEHNPLPAHGNHHAALPHLLTSTCTSIGEREKR